VLPRRHRQARVIAAQVHVQLPVRELAGHLMRPLDGERGLSGPGRPTDHADHHAVLRSRPAWQAGKEFQLGPAPGKVPRRGWQLPGTGAADPARGAA
jgi:hypothetical protein